MFGLVAQDVQGAKEVNVDENPRDKKQKKQSMRQEQAAAAEAEKQRQAQLELLLMDDRALQDAVRLGEVHMIWGCSIYNLWHLIGKGFYHLVDLEHSFGMPSFCEELKVLTARIGICRSFALC